MSAEQFVVRRWPDADVVTVDGQSIATDPFRKTHNPFHKE
jgi:hypothetical protein